MEKQKFLKIKKELLATKSARTIAKIINDLKVLHQIKAFLLFAPSKQAEISLLLSKDAKENIFNLISDHQIIEFLKFLDDDDDREVLSHLNKVRRKYISNQIKTYTNRTIQKIVKLDKNYLKKITDRDFILVKERTSIRDVSKKIGAHTKEKNKVPLVLTTNEFGIVTGFIPYKNLILNKKNNIYSLIKPLPILSHKEDKDKVLETVLKTDAEVIGVVNNDNEILGVIHLKDLVAILRTKATRAVYKFAGVNKEEQPDDCIKTKVTRRYKWLIINLATAALASMVVSIFEDAISQVSLLAVFMPMIAGEAGNGATQSLAVVVRGLAVNPKTSFKKATRIVMKESAAGIINGIIIGIISCGIALMLNAPILLGVILGVSMILNMLVAGFFGAATPFILKKFKIDPAIASSVFVTTATDVFGFFIFLGLGAWLLI